MAYLRRKTASGWEELVQPGAWPTQVPVQITEVDADLVPLTITENGTYLPEAPHNGYSSVEVDVPSVDETEYTASTRASKTASITFTGLEGNPREWWVEPNTSFQGDTSFVSYVVGGVKTASGAEMYICADASLTFSLTMQASSPTYSNGSLTVPSGKSSYYFHANTTYVLHYKL